MKRDDQIKFLNNAPDRNKERSNAFASDQKIKEALHKYDYLFDRHKPKVVNA